MWPWRKGDGRSPTARASFYERGSEILTMPEPIQTRKGVPIWLLLLVLAMGIASGMGVLGEARLVRELSAQGARQTRENRDLHSELDRVSRAQPAPFPAPVPLAAPRLAQPNAPANSGATPAAAEVQASRIPEDLGPSTAEVARLQPRLSQLQP